MFTATVLVAQAPGRSLAAGPAAAATDTAAIERMGAAQAMLAAKRGDVTLVDVRVVGQRQLGHIAGDVHIPVDELARRIGELPAARKWLFYCSCAAEETALDAARIAIRSGHARVAVLVGGFDAWRLAGGEVQGGSDWASVFRLEEPPVGWGKTPVDTLRCRYSLDPERPYRGGASACVTCRPDTLARGFAGYSQRLDGRSMRGMTLALSAIVRSAGLERHAFLWIASEDAQGRTRPISQPDASTFSGDQDWHAVLASGTVPLDATQVLVGVSLVGAGRIWLDDVRLEAAAPGRPGIRVVLRNHGFEE